MQFLDHDWTFHEHGPCIAVEDREDRDRWCGPGLWIKRGLSPGRRPPSPGVPSCAGNAQLQPTTARHPAPGQIRQTPTRRHRIRRRPPVFARPIMDHQSKRSFAHQWLSIIGILQVLGKPSIQHSRCEFGCVSGLQPLAAHAAAFREAEAAGRSHPISRTQIHRHIYFRSVPLPGQASWSTHPRASLLTHPLACPEISTSTTVTTSCLRFLRPAFRGSNPHKALAAWCYV